MQQVYLDAQTGAPSVVRVSTDIFAASQSLVPLLEATVEGNDLHVPYSKDQIQNAPATETSNGITAQDQARLCSYYNHSSAGGGAGQVLASSQRPVTVTPSEEALRIRTQIHGTEKVRLRKYIVTEDVTLTVSVSREEFRLEREPITDATLDVDNAALSGAELVEQDYDMVLHAQRPVIHLETVPVERVKILKRIITQEETVSEKVRQERIDTDGTYPS